MLCPSRSIHQPIIIEFRDVFRCSRINPSYGPGTTPRRTNERVNRNCRYRFPRLLAPQVVGGSARSTPDIVSQHEREADNQDADSDAHQHESSSCRPERCALPCPPLLVWDGCVPDRAGHTRRVIGSASRENRRLLSQCSKPQLSRRVLLKERVDKISRRKHSPDHKGYVKIWLGSDVAPSVEAENRARAAPPHQAAQDAAGGLRRQSARAGRR